MKSILHNYPVRGYSELRVLKIFGFGPINLGSSSAIMGGCAQTSVHDRPFVFVDFQPFYLHGHNRPVVFKSRLGGCRVSPKRWITQVRGLMRLNK